MLKFLCILDLKHKGDGQCHGFLLKTTNKCIFVENHRQKCGFGEINIIIEFKIGGLGDLILIQTSFCPKPRG